jgi:hypothetical protein
VECLQVREAEFKPRIVREREKRRGGEERVGEDRRGEQEGRDREKAVWGWNWKEGGRRTMADMSLEARLYRAPWDIVKCLFCLPQV